MSFRTGKMGWAAIILGTISSTAFVGLSSLLADLIGEAWGIAALFVSLLALPGGICLTIALAKRSLSPPAAAIGILLVGVPFVLACFILVPEVRYRVRDPLWTAYPAEFSGDGRLIATGEGHCEGAILGSTVFVWDRASGTKVFERSVPETGSPLSLALSPTGELLAVGYKGGIVRLWNLKDQNQKPTRFSASSEDAISIAFSPNGLSLAVSGFSPTISLWDVGSLKSRGVLKSAEMGAYRWPETSPGSSILRDFGRISPIVFTTSGSSLIAGNLDHLIRVWDLATGKEVACFRGHKGSVSSLAVSPDGGLLASGAADSTIRIWSLPKGVPQQTLQSKCNSTLSLDFSPDGKELITAGDTHGTSRDKDGFLPAPHVLWDVSSGRPLREFRTPNPHGSEIAVRHSPDGKHVNVVILKDQLKMTTGDEPAVSVRYSPDGKHLDFVTWTRRLWRWDVSTNKPVGWGGLGASTDNLFKSKEAKDW